MPHGPVDARWWNPAPADWVSWDFAWCELSPDRPPPPGAAELAIVPHQPEGFSVIDRTARSTVLHLPEPLSEAGLVHPYVGTTVAIRALWEGWQSFHAGSVLIDGAVWALLGEREHGKSSAVAWLAKHGVPVFTDDVLVIRDGTALAGPRALDLRQPASEHFGLGSSIGVVGTRERWRHHLGPVPAEAPFGGFVALEWHPEVEVRPVPAADRLRALGKAASLIAPGTELAWLDLISFPMLALRRPMSWGAIDRAMTALLAALG